MAITIGSLTKERREGKAKLTFDEQGEVRTEEIRISFRKPTEALWNELIAIGDVEDKATLVDQLVKLDLQSPDITNEDGTVHALTGDDLNALDLAQVSQLWAGVKDHFFLQMPASTPETNTSSSSAQTAG